VARLMEANITELPPASAVVAMAVAVVVGLLYCLAGYRVFHFLVGRKDFIAVRHDDCQFWINRNSDRTLAY